MGPFQMHPWYIRYLQEITSKTDDGWKWESPGGGNEASIIVIAIRHYKKAMWRQWMGVKFGCYKNPCSADSPKQSLTLWVDGIWSTIFKVFTFWK